MSRWVFFINRGMLIYFIIQSLLISSIGLNLTLKSSKSGANLLQQRIKLLKGIFGVSDLHIFHCSFLHFVPLSLMTREHVDLSECKTHTLCPFSLWSLLPLWSRPHYGVPVKDGSLRWSGENISSLSFSLTESRLQTWLCSQLRCLTAGESLRLTWFKHQVMLVEYAFRLALILSTVLHPKLWMFSVSAQSLVEVLSHLTIPPPSVHNPALFSLFAGSRPVTQKALSQQEAHCVLICCSSIMSRPKATFDTPSFLHTL